MITTIMVATGAALLIVGLYPFVMQLLMKWAHNQIVYRAMEQFDLEWEGLNGGHL